MLRRLTVFLLLVINTAAADDLSLPNTLSNNSVADANDVQQNFQALLEGPKQPMKQTHAKHAKGDQ